MIKNKYYDRAFSLVTDLRLDCGSRCVGSCEEVEGEFPAVRWTAGAQMQLHEAQGLQGSLADVWGVC